MKDVQGRTLMGSWTEFNKWFNMTPRDWAEWRARAEEQEIVARFDRVSERQKIKMRRLERKIRRLEFSGEHELASRLKGELEQRRRRLERARRQTLKNVIILDSTWESRRRVANRRRRFAIYRLYKYLNFSPEDIAYLLTGDTEWYLIESTIQTIRHNIGRAFKELCLRDNACVLKPFLLGSEGK